MQCEVGICWEVLSTNQPGWLRYWRRPAAYPEELMWRVTGDTSWMSCYRAHPCYADARVFGIEGVDQFCVVFARPTVEYADLDALCEEAGLVR